MIADALAQLALLVCGFGVLTVALVLGESVRVTYSQWRAERSEQRACERISIQQTVVKHEWVPGDVIARRRR